MDELTPHQLEILDRVRRGAAIIDWNAYERLHQKGLVQEVHENGDPMEFECRLTPSGEEALRARKGATP